MTDADGIVYFFIEAENFAEGNAAEFRDEGFTTWMGHPSGGRTLIYSDNQSGYTKYGLDGLKDGEYYLFVRHLAFAKPLASVEVFIGGASAGITDFDRAGTYLCWSKRIGPFRITAGAQLMMKVAGGSIQAPFADILLITNDPDCVPDNTDQDFKTYSRKASGIKIVSLGFTGENIRMGVESARDAEEGCAVSIDLEKSLTDSRVFTAKARIKKGRNDLVVECPGLEQGNYIMKAGIKDFTGALLAERSGRISAADFPLTVLPESYYYLESDARGRIKAEVNKPEIAGSAGSYLMSIKSPDGKTTETAIPAQDFKNIFEFSLEELVPGKYGVAVAVLGRDGKALAKGETYFIKTRHRENMRALEDIKEVTIKNKAVYVNGEPFVPVKLYHAPGEPNIKMQGFNAVDCWATNTLEDLEKMMDQARKSNLYAYATLYHPHFYKGVEKGFDLEAVRKAAEKLKNHPSLLMWELFDEPEGPGLPVDRLVSAYRVIKETDPKHPVLLNFCFPEKFAEYEAAADIISCDTYPVPFLPLTMISDYLDKLDAAGKGNKPLQTCQQTYGDIRGRMPTPEELRCMTYLAVNHGAKLFAAYSYNEAGDYPFCLSADRVMWGYMRCLNSELTSLKNVIAALPAPNKVTGSDPSLDLSLKKAGNYFYLIAVNKENRDAGAAEIRIENMKDTTKTKVLFERRKPVVKKDADTLSLTDSFRPYGAHIYKIQ